MNALILAALLAANSPYISRVYEFQPAPGQFLNDVPEVTGDPVAAAEEQIAGGDRPGMISLGAFGGYVIFGFDHPVVNVSGQADFRVYGNAVLTSEAQHTGSAEPGVVWVSRDDNGNGLPDDQWFELKGSESDRSQRNLTITYHRPAADHVATPDPNRRFVTDMKYIAWECSDGTSGWLEKNTQHAQDYWPDWVDDDTLTFENVTRLPDNAEDANGLGTNFVSHYYDWGYADNRPVTDPEGFDIGNAIDSDGRPVHLTHIHFVKVQTAVRQTLGWLGESSTEVTGGEDLHPDAPVPDTGVVAPSDDAQTRRAYDLQGRDARGAARLVKHGAHGDVIIR